MLVVKVELWPGGWSANARELGRAAAANVSGSSSDSDYLAVLDAASGHRSAVLLTGHRRASGFWPLVARIADSHRTAADRSGLDPEWRDLTDLITDRMYEDRG